MTQLRSDYLRTPPPKVPEFWTPERIEHLRLLATTGKATASWATPVAGPRALDQLGFAALAGVTAMDPDALSVDPSVRLAREIHLERPLYFGDMSYGSLSGIPNVALARAADETGALAGTGEGGLHPDVAACKNITVQWASARFGVTPQSLKRGKAVVIKVGQGAKPGVGGHLPASKVTDVIRRTRRIPTGRDAISPAPHHDIYSIEDLGQRIAALKRMSGRPVIVKVAATNYAPFIACGVARMGGDGIILDGAGAGTGASPSVMKDHVGLPVEYATAGVDQMLRREGLRDGFSVVAAGTVASPLDAAKLTALGADCVSIGTGSLVAMGCIMVHKCHVGSCPALLTTPAQDDPARALDVDWLTRLQSNLVLGWTEELQGILHALGLQRLSDLVGRRDLLSATGPLDADAAELFGVIPGAQRSLSRDPVGGLAADAWNKRLTGWVRDLAGGKAPGEALISSMGSTAAPFAEPALRPLDHLRMDGAQVTRPAIDSYREPVATHLRLASGLRLAAPLMLTVPAGRPDVAVPVAGAAAALGLLATAPEPWSDAVSIYGERCLRPHDDVLDARGDEDGPRILRVPSGEGALAALPRNRRDFDAILVDEDVPAPDPIPLEVFVAEADRAAGPRAPDLLASSSRLRGAGDAAKLVALGAAAVGMPGVVEQALKGVDDPEGQREALEYLAFGLMREVKLLLGAAGCTSLPSLRGNRELLRAVALDRTVRQRLGVKPAGWG